MILEKLLQKLITDLKNLNLIITGGWRNLLENELLEELSKNNKRQVTH